jgi:hypothetical protein
LNAYQELIIPNGEPLHAKLKDTLDAIMCMPILKRIHKWEYVLGRCTKCSKYPMPTFKSTPDENDAFTKIPFCHYKNFTKFLIHKVLDEKAKQWDACEEQHELNALFKKGKICQQKELTHLEETIGHFMEEFLEKY